MSDEDKTYDPTPQKREDARKEGRFARSRDAGGVASTFGLMLALFAAGPALMYAARALFARSLGDVGALVRGDIVSPSTAALAVLALGVLPAACLAALASFGTGVAQSGMRFDTDLIQFKPDRLDPMGKLKQMLDPKHFGAEVLMSLAKVGVTGIVAYRALKEQMPGLLLTGREPLPAAIQHAIAAIGHVAMVTGGALAVLCAVEYGKSFFEIEKQLKMSRKEVMDESKAQDGDPRTKSRMRSAARKMLQKRSLKNVSQADVVITNPTHVAVALRYGQNDAAPTVMAKGHDEFALAIRREARKHGIPIVENRPLARAIDKEVDIGKGVPEKHFLAVARILAFVYRLKGKS